MTIELPRRRSTPSLAGVQNPVAARTRVRNTIILATSVALHALVLGYLAVQGFQPPRRFGDDRAGDAPPIVFLQIEPRPLMQGERPRPPVERRVRDIAPQAADATASTSAGRPAPSPPRPRLLDDGAPAPPADVGSNAWTVRPDAVGDRIARNLRVTSGCASPELLSVGERASCDERFGERAAQAAPIQGTGDAARDGRFAAEGARALARYEARRRPLGANRGDYRPNDCPGSNLGFNCAGAHLDRGFRQDREEDLDAALGRDRGDLSRPRLPHAATRND